MMVRSKVIQHVSDSSQTHSSKFPGRMVTFVNEHDSIYIYIYTCVCHIYYCMFITTEYIFDHCDCDLHKYNKVQIINKKQNSISFVIIYSISSWLRVLLPVQ